MSRRRTNSNAVLPSSGPLSQRERGQDVTIRALTAATLNPAWVLGLSGEVGTLEVGKRADVVLLEHPSFAQVPYRPGHDPVVATIVGGVVVRDRSERG